MKTPSSHSLASGGLSRRQFLQGAAAGAAMLAWPLSSSATVRRHVLATPLDTIDARTRYDLTIARTPVNFTGTPAQAVTINGSIPGPLLKLREGETVTIAVNNKLDELTAVHWHGLLVPNKMDGVPGVTFPGIRTNETFEYQFKLRQSGTYWYHSHAILQEPAGFYAPIIIEPERKDPFGYDRDYVVLLSDWNDTKPEQVLANLKKVDGYYNFRRLTIPDLFASLRAAKTPQERSAIWDERMAWAKMRMDPTDVTDGGPEWQFLAHGQRIDDNWTALFKPGERIRLRLINGASMNFFDVSIPGLEMTVVAADGQNVRPVKVRELRMGNGETYDVIVQPTERKAYTLFAATAGRIGFARGTLAPEAGMEGVIPPLGERPVLTIAELGSAHSHGSAPAEDGGDPHAGHGAAADPHAGHGAAADPHAGHGEHASHGAAADAEEDLDEDRVRDKLAYKDLEALAPNKHHAKPTRTITMRLTGEMNRYIWTINGKKLSEATLFQAKVGERLEVKLTNDTMMAHPMHMHGAFFELQNGQGPTSPMKHTVIVKPGETVVVHTTFDEAGPWVFHCHLFYHAAAGMIQAIVVQ
jgi:CopA family copper-resistance protein